MPLYSTCCVFFSFAFGVLPFDPHDEEVPLLRALAFPGLAQKMPFMENLLRGHRNVRFEDIVIRFAGKQGDVGQLP